MRKVIGDEPRVVQRAADALLAANAAGGTCLACRAFAGAPKTRFFRLELGVYSRTLARGYHSVCLVAVLITFCEQARLLEAINFRSAARKALFVGGHGYTLIKYRLLAAIPAVFLATLFFLDQNITVRTVNSPQNKLKKGAAYHLDLFALASITLALATTRTAVDVLGHGAVPESRAGLVDLRRPGDANGGEGRYASADKPSKPAPPARRPRRKGLYLLLTRSYGPQKPSRPPKSPSRRPATSSSRGLW